MFHQEAGIEDLLRKLVLPGIFGIEPFLKCYVFNVSEEPYSRKRATCQRISTKPVMPGFSDLKTEEPVPRLYRRKTARCRCDLAWNDEQLNRRGCIAEVS